MSKCRQRNDGGLQEILAFGEPSLDFPHDG